MPVFRTRFDPFAATRAIEPEAGAIFGLRSRRQNAVRLQAITNPLVPELQA